jgi:HAD superfamily hydrolase (TIGR01509 family)
LSAEPGRPQLVIFDCDGVLVDSEPISNAVLAAALTRAGIPTTTEEALSTYKGLRLDDVIERAGARLGAALPADFVATFEADRERAFREALVPVAGARETVQAIAAAGVPVAVASQGKLEKTEMTLGLTGLRPLFAPGAVFTAWSVPEGKPHPDVYLHAAAAMGAAPQRCAVVEDTVLGVTAGVAAGMRTFGFVPAGDEAALAAAGAEVVRTLPEVVDRLDLG